jgi:beta-carotene 3-hydroxylase
MILAITIAITFFLMEGVAWGMHKYIMHGVFWNLHEDHHNKKKMAHSFFERNDSFFILFSILAMSSFAIWTFYASYLFLGIGIGITIYGMAYFVVHDLFIHQRIKIWKNTKNRYLLALRRGHKMHHKHLGKNEGECFGMLWVPFKYFKQEFKS